MESSEVLTENREMSLEKALETIKGINDRYELQTRLVEAAARERRAHAAAEIHIAERKRRRRIWR
jgi:hypothetical protein